MENQISNLSHEIVSKTDEIERVQANMKVTKEANIELERANREKENMVSSHSVVATFTVCLSSFYKKKTLNFIKISEQASEREHMKNEVNDARHQLQHCLNEVKFFELLCFMNIQW